MLLLILVLLSPLSETPRVVCVAANPVLNTTCIGDACSSALHPHTQRNANQTPALSFPAVTVPEFILPKLTSSSSSLHHSCEDTPDVPLVVQEVGMFSRSLLPTSRDQGGQDAPASLRHDLWWLGGLLRRSVVGKAVEFLRESYLNGTGLEDMLTDVEETLRDLNDRQPETWSPPTHPPPTNALVSHRTKREDFYTYYLVRNIISFTQVILIFAKKITTIASFLYKKINIRA